MTKQIINCETGEIIERDLTEQELAQQEKDTATALRIQAELDELRAEAEAKKSAAEAKLAALGLTADDLKALGL
jgi:FMN-dependent NADH-azoreductase